jgi:hypothetical protein
MQRSQEMDQKKRKTMDSWIWVGTGQWACCHAAINSRSMLKISPLKTIDVGSV